MSILKKIFGSKKEKPCCTIKIKEVKEEKKQNCK